MNVATPNPISNRKEQTMKPFARINLFSAALRMGISVSSLAREGNVANVEVLPIPIPISTERS